MDIKRDIYTRLLSWKNDTNKRPVLLRGARQIGKTYVISSFGNTEFSSFITLNFERNPEYKEIFSSFVPSEIIERISLFTGKWVVPGNTLLFFDEIQECPNAIAAMRYFFEEMPNLHIIGAGSLLEFMLQSANFKMPVGRIQYLFMQPLSFGEFLDALGEENLRIYLLDFENLAKIPVSIHQKLNELVRKYFLLGGMPAVVKEYAKTGNVLKCFALQRSVIDTYTDDFAKYSGISKHIYLQKLMESVPRIIGQKLVYSNIDQTVKSRELKEAFELLEKAGVLHAVSRTNGNLPLIANAKEDYFKPIFLDIGLLHAMVGIHTDTATTADFSAVFKGAVSEQFVGQELLAYQLPVTKPRIFYWVRDERNSTAEIDYLIQIKSEILPIEVKSGATGRLKSLNMFLDSYKIAQGYKVSLAPFQSEPPIISLPFYALESFIKRLQTDF